MIEDLEAIENCPGELIIQGEFPPLSECTLIPKALETVGLSGCAQAIAHYLLFCEQHPDKEHADPSVEGIYQSFAYDTRQDINRGIRELKKKKVIQETNNALRVVL